MTKRQIDLLIYYIELRANLSASTVMNSGITCDPSRAKEAERAFRESFEENTLPRRKDPLTTQQRLTEISTIFDLASAAHRELTPIEKSHIWQLAAGSY
jgi:hypothetical protein